MKVLIIGDSQQMAPLLTELINEKTPIPVFGYGAYQRLTEIVNVRLNKKHPRHEIVCIVGFRDLENLVAIVDEADKSKDVVINPADFDVAFITGSLAGDFEGAQVTDKIGDTVSVIEMDCFVETNTSSKATFVSMKPIVYAALKLGWLTVGLVKDAQVSMEQKATISRQLAFLKKNIRKDQFKGVRQRLDVQITRELHRSKYY